MVSTTSRLSHHVNVVMIAGISALAFGAMNTEWAFKPWPYRFGVAKKLLDCQPHGYVQNFAKIERQPIKVSTVFCNSKLVSWDHMVEFNTRWSLHILPILATSFYCFAGTNSLCYSNFKQVF